MGGGVMMRWMVVVVLAVSTVVAGVAFAGEEPGAAEVASSARAVRGQAALESSLAEGWRVVGQRETPDGVVYELAWGEG